MLREKKVDSVRANAHVGGVQAGLLTRWNTQIFVRPVAARVAGLAMLHRKFSSRANDAMYLTRKDLGKIRNRSQLAAIGVPWPPPKGWNKPLRNTVIPDEQWQKILSLSTQNAANPDRNRDYLNYLNSEHWKTLKAKKKSIVGRRCEACQGGGTIHVHHINYRNLIDCGTDDLAVLCSTCHNALHTFASRRCISLIGVMLPEIKTMLDEFRRSPEFLDRETKLAARKEFRRTKSCGKLNISTQARKAIKRCRKAGYSRETIAILVNELQELLSDSHASNNQTHPVSATRSNPYGRS